MKIAVTAASGALGGAIVQALKSEIGAENVIAVARTPDNAAKHGVEVRKGDYKNREDLEVAFQGVDAVLLVSGMDAPDKRIGQHRNVIEAAKTAGVGKIVYTSIQGAEAGNAFSPIVQSNRQTEQDIRDSGLDWVIGRNGLYIEPDIEYVENYLRDGKIRNCAGDGKCGYTSRTELGYAYAKMLTENKHNGQTYRLHGASLTQAELATYISNAYGQPVVFSDMSVEAFGKRSVMELGEFIGTVVTGIYAGIRTGAWADDSDYHRAAGRPHQSWEDYFASLK